MDLSKIKSIFKIGGGDKNAKGNGAAGAKGKSAGGAKSGANVKGGAGAHGKGDGKGGAGVHGKSGKVAAVSPSKARLERRANDDKIIKIIKITFTTIVVIAVIGIVLSVFLYVYKPTVATIAGAGIKQYELTYQLKGLSKYSSSYSSNDTVAQQAIDYASLSKIKEVIAKERGFSLTKEDRDEIQYQLDYIDQLATQDGDYTKTGDDFLRENYGVTKAQFKKIMETDFLGYRLIDDEENKISVPDEDAQQIYDDDADSYEEATVRHILLMYEGNSDTEEPRTRDESLQIAEEVMARINAGEDMAELVHEYSEDNDLSNDGIYTFKKNDSYEQGFLDWTFDESRKIDDVGICETSYGYHVMRLEDRHTIPFEEVKDEIVHNIKDEQIDNLVETWRNDPKYKVNVNQRVYDSLVAQVLGEG